MQFFFTQPGFYADFTPQNGKFLTTQNLQLKIRVNDKIQYHYLKIITNILEYTNISTKMPQTYYFPAFPRTSTQKDCKIWTTYRIYYKTSYVNLKVYPRWLWHFVSLVGALLVQFQFMDIFGGWWRCSSSRHLKY